jgi:hypothetical protein
VVLLPIGPGNDLLSPRPVEAANCDDPVPAVPTAGCMIVRKVVINGDGTDLFAFNMGDPQVGLTATDLGNGGTMGLAFADPAPASITINESLLNQEGWALSISCSASGSPDDLVIEPDIGLVTFTPENASSMIDCTFTNTNCSVASAPTEGCVIVRKEIINGDPEDAFAFNVGDPNLGVFGFDLKDGGSNGFATRNFLSGDLNIDESLVDKEGWAVSIECTASGDPEDVVIDLDIARATFTPDDVNSMIDCTFTNVFCESQTFDALGCLYVTKLFADPTDTRLVPFDVTVGDTVIPTFDLGHNGTRAIVIPENLQENDTIVIDEDLSPGWKVSIDCGEADDLEGLSEGTPDLDNGSIALTVLTGNEPDRTAHCTFTNTPPACDPVPSAPTGTVDTDPRALCLIVRKTVNGTPPQDDFEFSISGNGDGQGGFGSTPNFFLNHGESAAYLLIGGVETGHTITIDEIIPSGWSLSISCAYDGFNDKVFSDPPLAQPLVNEQEGSVTFIVGDELPADRFIDCMYTNTEPPSCNQGTVTVAALRMDRCLIVEKQIFPFGGTRQFAFQASGAISDSFSLTDDETYGMPLSLSDGQTITISETQVLPWLLFGVDCSDSVGFSVGPVINGSITLTATPLGQGETRGAVCVFTNVMATGGDPGVPMAPTPTSTPTRTPTSTATPTATPTSTPPSAFTTQRDRPNLSGLFPLPGTTPQPAQAAQVAPATNQTIRPPSTGDAGLR